MLHLEGDPPSVPPTTLPRTLTTWLAILIASASLVACGGTDSPMAMTGLPDGGMSSGGQGGSVGQGGNAGSVPDAAPKLDGALAGNNGATDVLPSTPDAGAGGTGGQAGGNDGGLGSDAGTCAVQPQSHAAWLTAYQMDHIARLTGKTDYEPGKTLTNRGLSATRLVARQLLVTALNQLGLTAQLHNYGTGTNVYALLPSTTGNPEQVLLGAHYDTVTNSPGANDNATGVAAVLAAARALKDLPCRSRAVLFVLFDQEEVGIIGSEAFAAKLAADNAPVHSVHTVDQVGWDEDKDRVIELERGEPTLRKLYEDAVTSLGIDVTLSPTNTGSTDHVSFRPRYRAIGVTEEYAADDTSPHRHRATDTHDTVDFPYLATASTLVIRVMENLMR